jgi:hypothetical protein
MTQQQDGLLIVGEALCQELVGRKDAFDAVEAVFGAMARGMPITSPWCARRSAMPMRSMASSPGFDRAGQGAGREVGRLLARVTCREGPDQPPVDRVPVQPRHWPAFGAGGRQLPDRRAHRGLVAVSIAHLARKDAKVLGMVGRRAPIAVPAARRRRTARFREGRRVEPAPRDDPRAGQGRRRAGARLRGGQRKRSWARRPM